MNRKQRVEMILRVLLLPFTQTLLKEDLLCAAALSYREMVRCTSADPYIRKTNQDGYRKSWGRLERVLEEQTQCERLGELEQLLEMFYPAEELKDYLDSRETDRLDGYYIQHIFQIAAEFITLRDGVLSIRMWEEKEKDKLFRGQSGLYKAEMWSALSRIATPDLFLAGYFAGNQIDDIRLLFDLPENVFLSDTLLAKVNRHGVAETHMHMSAGMSYLTVWSAVTDPLAQRLAQAGQISALHEAQREEQLEHESLFVAGWLRLLMAYYLEQSGDVDISESFFSDSAASNERSMEQHILRHMLRESVSQCDILHLLGDLRPRLHYPESLQRLVQVYQLDREPALDILLRGPYKKYRGLRTEPELLLLYSALRHIRRYPGHRNFLRLFLHYVRMKNQYFSDKMQTYGPSGLTFFRRYFHKAASAMYTPSYPDEVNERLIYQAVFRSQFRCQNLQKLEVKISPRIPTNWEKALPFFHTGARGDKQAIANQLLKIFTAFLNVCREHQGRSCVPTLGIVYHFIKSDVYRPSNDQCWVRTNENHEPMDFVSQVRAQCVRFLKALQLLLREVPYLCEYVVGLDAASQELDADPWVYAPVYRAARNRSNTVPVQLETMELMQGIGLTYHVGEDYRHLLSGLRHIDEVLTYLGYKPGDRIGHGLALQVDVAEWLHNNETVPLPMLEHLENQLWLWALCGEAPEQLGGYRYDLEAKIMELAAGIYQNTRGLSPHVLWEGYRRKFAPLTPQKCEQIRRLYLQDMPEGEFCRCRHYTRSPLQSFCIGADSQDPSWDADKLCMTNYCPIYTRHARKPVFVSSTPEQLAMLQAVQRYMREKVQNAGIFVETNPTSNISIGDIRSVSEYPITALNGIPPAAVRQNSILLSINSDDPLVFNTNVENELALVYHTLAHQGYEREKILQWMDKVRQYGMDSSFIRTVKSPQQQCAELEVIIERLKIIMGTFGEN